MRKLDLLFARAQRDLHFPEKAARDLVPVFRNLRESSGLRRLTSLLRLLDALVEQGGTPMAELNFGFGDSEGSESIRRARTILLSEFRENLVHEEVAMRVHCRISTGNSKRAGLPRRFEPTGIRSITKKERSRFLLGYFGESQDGGGEGVPRGDLRWKRENQEGCAVSNLPHRRIRP